MLPCGLGVGASCDLALPTAASAEEIWRFADVRGRPTWLEPVLSLSRGSQPSRKMTSLNIAFERLVVSLPRKVRFAFAFQQHDHITLQEVNVIKTG